MTNGSVYVSMKDITKTFGSVAATQGMNLEVQKGRSMPF
jgi:ABC-type sugar transport system ATPase subunit